MLKPSLPSLADQVTEPYTRLEVLANGFRCDSGPLFNWNYIFTLSRRFRTIKGKNRYPLSWTGPNTQCWCRNILLRNRSQCSQCQRDCRMWKTLKKASLRELVRCCPEQLPTSKSSDNEEEVYMLTTIEEEETETFSIPNEHYEDMLNTLQPTLTEELTQYLRPYQNVEFTPEGIHYEGQNCTWYYIEHISARLSQKFNRRAWPRDWKGPAAQCWCGDKLYSHCDECPKCHSDLRLWMTIKSYPIEEIAKCYWPTPDTGEEDDQDNFDQDFELPEFIEDNVTPFMTDKAANQYLLEDFDNFNFEEVPNDPSTIDWESSIAKRSVIEEIPLSSYLVAQSWWLPPLKPPTLLMYIENNNFSEYYLCNMVW